MEEKKIEYPGFLNKLWYDPIWSKIIYSGIIFIIGLLYTFISTIFNKISFKETFIDTVNYSLKLYVIFIIITLVLLVYGIIHQIKQKKNKKIGVFDVEQRIGYFTFREMYNALLTDITNTPSPLIQNGADENKTDLLTLFILYQVPLNRGMEWNQDYYTYYELAPMLMSYGLVEKVPTTNKLDDTQSDMVQTSKIGYEFYALLAKWRIYNNQNMDKVLIKIDKKTETNPLVVD